MPKVTMSRCTPMARWCELRPIVRRAVEAARRRAQGDDVTADMWDAAKRVLAGVIPVARPRKRWKSGSGGGWNRS